jgi:L-methionine (R)-S-oxide reductase
MSSADLIARLEALSRAGEPFDGILRAAVEGLAAANPRFQWTGIYELGSDNVLTLGPFVGAPTDHVRIPAGRGVCGTAVTEKRDLNVADVRALSNYLACSFETRSELVVLIRTGETIHAQIDIDSHDVGKFDDATVASVRRVADWLAAQYAGRTSRSTTGP